MAKRPSKPKAPATKEHHSRAVDLGREEQFVTWSEWFGRTMAHMSEVVPAEQRDKLQFCITLADGRRFLVRQVLTHVVRGRCSLDPTRWDDGGAVCDVITGYMLLGENDEGDVTVVSVPPTEISTVECILKREEDRAPFGFRKHEALSLPCQQREIEEQAI